MIKLTEGALADLWPDKSSPEINALSAALLQGVKLAAEHADRTMCYAGIDKLLDAALDELAVENRSMYYDQTAALDVKRSVVKGTLNWYTHAGTPSAVAELVAAVFGGGDVVEWFDYSDPPYTPWTFDVVSSGPIGAQETFEDMLKKVKNVRSHLRRVVYAREAHQAACQIMYGIAVQECVCANYTRQDASADSQMNAGAYIHASEGTTVLNAITADISAHSGTAVGQIAEPGGYTTAII